MTEERITETRDDNGQTHTTHTIVRDDQPRRSGGGMLMILIVLAVLAAGAFFIFNQVGESEIAANDAVADTANKVGEAADNVGAAAKDAADSLDGE